jgi:hypothetical protein
MTTKEWQTREALWKMVHQFAHARDRRNNCGDSTVVDMMHTSGWPTLRRAFAVLGLSDPVTVVDFIGRWTEEIKAQKGDQG